MKRSAADDLARPPPGAAQVSRETRERLDALLALLLRWNARINLVARQAPEEIRQRHIEDSLQLLPLLPEGLTPLADLGSGGGFPGLVLAAAATRPVHLVESDRRKAAFLQAAVAELGLPHVTVHAVRIETLDLPPVGVLTARALAPLERLLPWAAALLAPEGVALFPKGRQVDQELSDAEAAGWTFSVERFMSNTDPKATILRMSGIHRAGA